MPRPTRTWLLAISAAALALGAACFHQRQPPCAFSCVEPPHLCPSGYSCSDGGICIREGADPTQCTLRPPDAGATDAIPTDGADQ